jgi:hypothetical protein
MICFIDVPFKSGLTIYMVGLPWFVVWYKYTTNRGKPTIYTVKSDLKGTSMQQIMVNQPYIVKPVLKGTSIQQILTVYMVGLPWFVV